MAALGGCVVPGAVQRGALAVSPPLFNATFDTSSDFFDRFDFGYSGFVPGENGAASTDTSYHGDHNMACEGPTTSRDVTMSGPANKFDFSQLFWFCAPKGPASGHVMTAVDTTGYNIAWFSPKPLFTNVSQVCWDINETAMSRRKWTQVVFVSQADAVRYPSGAATAIGGVARGTGGFDLGYTSPDFRDPKGPNSGLFPQAPIAGFRDLDGSANWFQDASWTAEFVGPTGPDREQTTDKAARFKHCLTNGPNNTVILTKDTPTTGTVTRTLPGQIPQGPVRVVFQDDNYDPIKDSPANGQPEGRYDPNVLTWHWDNIQVFSGSASAAPPPPRELSAPVGPPPSQAAALATPAAVPESQPGERGAGPSMLAANVAGFGITVAALALIVGLWSGRRRRASS